MINEDIIKLKKELFEGEYSDILKAISSSNTFLAKSTIESYLREFSADNNKRKLNAISYLYQNIQSFIIMMMEV